MTNNLLNLKKDLKSFAKNVKILNIQMQLTHILITWNVVSSTGEMFAETEQKHRE